MAKAAYVPGGMTDELNKNKDKAPGPGHYYKDILAGGFVKGTKGGTFSKLARDWGKKIQDAGKMAPGSYDVPMQARRVKFGIMSKNDRICAFAKMADKQNIWNPNGPGKYDGKPPARNVQSPTFNSPKTESRNPPTKVQIGPGHYNPDYRHAEKRAPNYSGGKEEIGGFMTRMNKDRNQNPFANYKDMPESKLQDKLGARKHCKKLLNDRQVTPRQVPNRYEAARSCTPGRATPRSTTPGRATPRPRASSRQATPRPGDIGQTPRDVAAIDLAFSEI